MFKKSFIFPLVVTVSVLTLAIGFYIIFDNLSSPFQPNAKDVHNYELVFQDEFDGDSLDSKKWVTCYDWANSQEEGCTNFGNNELEWYKQSQVKVFDGSLHLIAEKINTNGQDKEGKSKVYPFRSGMVTTGNSKYGGSKWINAYGYYEARMNSPEGKGIWPAFWLLPENSQWPPEIDIMEILGDKPDEILNTYFWSDTPGHVAKDPGIFKAKEKHTNAWHTYGVNWQKNSIDWYIDGEKVRSISGDTVPSEPMMIIFNLAIGGNLPGAPDDRTRFPAALLVDYVRVYKSKGN